MNPVKYWGHIPATTVTSNTVPVPKVTRSKILQWVRISDTFLWSMNDMDLKRLVPHGICVHILLSSTYLPDLFVTYAALWLAAWPLSLRLWGHLDSVSSIPPMFCLQLYLEHPLMSIRIVDWRASVMSQQSVSHLYRQVLTNCVTRYQKNSLLVRVNDLHIMWVNSTWKINFTVYPERKWIKWTCNL